MALYVPPSFAGDAALAARLVDEYPFATLLTPTDVDPWITHLPLLRDGDGALLGHVARANPHWRQFDGRTSIAIFHGPHAYVSPTWYAEPDVAVPTWNFATVHVAGRIAVIDDPDEREQAMARMVARFEGDGDGAWRFALRGERREAMLAAIVAFRLTIATVSAKFKLSQNRGAADRERVATALASSDDAAARETAAWMVQGPRRTSP